MIVSGVELAGVGMKAGNRKEATVSEVMWVWDYELKTLGSWPSTGYNGHNTPVEVVTQMDVKAIRDERDRLREALEGILDIGKRDMTNPKYDGYFEAARAALTPVEGGQDE